jgi:hypothetical protein
VTSIGHKSDGGGFRLQSARDEALCKRK